MRWTRILILAGLIFAILPSASADTLQYSDSGAFSPSTPSSAFSGPSDTWAFSFQIDSNPTASNPTPFNFQPAFSNFSYLLNGSPVPIAPTRLIFFDTAGFGGAVICFSAASPCTDGFDLNGGDNGGVPSPQMFTGMTSAPTMSAGAFTLPEWSLFVNNIQYIQAGSTTLEAVPTPEPSSLLLLGTGLLALMAMTWRGRLRKQVSA